ncbi:MAG: hypothetical protein EZS28_039827, partial [Streblomastix strix]
MCGESWGVEWDLELEVFTLAGNSSGVDGIKVNEKLLPERDCNDSQHGQCGIGVEHQEMESEETDIVIAEKDPGASDGHGRVVTDTTHSGGGEQSSGSTEQNVNERGLLDQIGGIKRSAKPVRTSCMVGCLRDKNEQTIAKVLQLVSRQRSIQSQRAEHELVEPKPVPTSSSQPDTQGTSESREGQSTSDNYSSGLERSGLVKPIERDESGGGGSGASGGVSGEKSIDGQSESVSPIRKDESGKGDKHAAGEELFRRMAGRVGLDGEAMNNMNESSSMETWRKRRIGLHVFCVYMEENNMELEEVFKASPDVILSNALSWREKKGGKGALEEMRKLKTHMGILLSMFSDMRDVASSPMVQAIIKRLKLERPNKAKYPTVQNINQLLICIANSEMKHGRLQMRKVVALLVAFSGAKMMELAAIQKKGHYGFWGRDYSQYNNQEEQKVENKKDYIKNKGWTVLSGESDERMVKKELASIGCSKELRKILDYAEVDGCYASSTVRYAMMTKLRGEGASLEEVNDFTGHALWSGIMYVFYNKPIARDIGALILEDSE